MSKKSCNFALEMKKSLLYIIIAVAFIETSCREQATSYEVSRLDSICTSLFPADEPGAAVLIMRHDSILFSRGYGLADLETRQPIDENTFFNIASVSKQFTAVAILQLADAGLISLDDAVAQYFPFRSAIWKEVRIRDLLSHSSGVPDERGYLSREERIYGTDSLAMAYLFTLDHLHFSPGSAYEYINPTYTLCGALIEKVTGLSFPDYMQQQVFAAADMKAFYFDPANFPPKAPGLENISIAHAYEYADVSDMPEERTADATTSDTPKHWYEYDYGEETFFATRPDGGLYTSTRQFTHWEQALTPLNPLLITSLINVSTLAEAWQPHTLVSGSPWSDYQNRPNTWYGYGWFIEPATDSTRTVIYHTGDNGGFKILAARYPDSDALVLVFANRADWDRYALKTQIEDLFHLKRLSQTPNSSPETLRNSSPETGHESPVDFYGCGNGRGLARSDGGVDSPLADGGLRRSPETLRNSSPKAGDACAGGV